MRQVTLYTNQQLISPYKFNILSSLEVMRNLSTRVCYIDKPGNSPT